MRIEPINDLGKYADKPAASPNPIKSNEAELQSPSSDNNSPASFDNDSTDSDSPETSSPKQDGFDFSKYDPIDNPYNPPATNPDPSPDSDPISTDMDSSSDSPVTNPNLADSTPYGPPAVNSASAPMHPPFSKLGGTNPTQPPPVNTNAPDDLNGFAFCYGALGVAFMYIASTLVATSSLFGGLLFAIGGGRSSSGMIMIIVLAIVTSIVAVANIVAAFALILKHKRARLLVRAASVAVITYCITQIITSFVSLSSGTASFMAILSIFLSAATPVVIAALLYTAFAKSDKVRYVLGY
jgi:hypothetical protein